MIALQRGAGVGCERELVSTERPVVRCGFCRLVQFRIASKICRRCKNGYESQSPILQSVSAETQRQSDAGGKSQPDFGESLLGFRMARNMTQQDLACAAGMNRTYIAKAENAKLVPLLDQVARIARALDIGVVDLLGDRKHTARLQAAILLQDPFLADLAKVAGTLTDLQRRVVVNGARRMASKDRTYLRKRSK